jgi:hypothetical protein
MVLQFFSHIAHVTFHAAAVLTAFGSFLLYSKIEDNGCDPGGAVKENDTCPNSGADVFGAMLGTTPRP